MNKMTRRALPALVLAAFSGAAPAASFQVWEQSASGIATSFAGSAAVADNASTNYYNPAGLTQLGGFQFSAGVVGSRANIDFKDRGSSQAGNNGGNAGNGLALGNVYVSAPLANGLYFGFGISTPFALANDYASGWHGDVQARKSDIAAVNYNPSLAYRVSDKVSLGVGLNYQKLDVDLSTSAYRFKADDTGLGWNAGALFTLSPAMKVGVAYRSAIDYTLAGTHSVNGTAKADIKLPDSFTLSVWQQVSDHWEAMGDLSYTNWSTLDNLNIRAANGALTTESYHFKDSWRFAWGAAYKASDLLKLKFGVAYDRSPVRNSGERNARTPDGDQLWLSLGGQWQAGKAGKVDLGYAYLFSRDVKIEQTIGANTLRGEYSNSRHVLGLQYSLGF